MSLESDMLDAMFPEPIRLLGVNLRPFSYGSMAIMRWLGNAYVCGGVTSVDDLVSGVWVCGLPYAEAIGALRSGSMEILERGRVRDRRRTMSTTEVIAAWQKQVGEFDFDEKSQEFHNYIAAACKSPIVSSKAQSTTDDGEPCPSLQAIRVTLIKHLHITDAELMDKPWIMCLWDYYTLLVQDGVAKFIDQSSIDSAIAAADNVAKLVAEGKVKPDGA